MKKYILPNEFDEKLVDLFDEDSVNELGDMYCLGFALTYGEAEEMWDDYIETCRASGRIALNPPRLTA